jgi:DNA primase large subunit
MPLAVLTELETCTFRNRTPEETRAHMTPILLKYLPLQRNSAQVDEIAHEERRRDHYSHFILRLAFSKTEELRRRFSRLESMLFRIRYQTDDAQECSEFTKSLNFAWETVSAEEMESVGELLKAATGNTFVKTEDEAQEYFKVDWEQVPELVEQRKVYLSDGLAYVPMQEQMTLVISEFSRRLDEGLEVSLLHFCLNPLADHDLYNSLYPALLAALTKTTVLNQSSNTSLAPLPLQMQHTTPMQHPTTYTPQPTMSRRSPNISRSACLICRPPSSKPHISSTTADYSTHFSSKAWE